jgi:translation initiation factor 4E
MATAEDASAPAQKAEAPVEEGGEEHTLEINANSPKHPLRCQWTLWFDSNLVHGRQRNQDWNVKDVLSFKHVEDFWRLHNNMTKPTSIPQGCGFALFRYGVEPKWEDPANAKGGRWTVVVEKNSDMTNNMWLRFQLAMVGEMLEDDTGDFICGATCNLRKQQNKLCLWTRDAQDNDRNLKIGRALRRELALPQSYHIKFNKHDSTRDMHSL